MKGLLNKQQRIFQTTLEGIKTHHQQTLAIVGAKLLC